MEYLTISIARYSVNIIEKNKNVRETKMEDLYEKLSCRKMWNAIKAHTMDLHRFTKRKKKKKKKEKIDDACRMVAHIRRWTESWMSCRYGVSVCVPVCAAGYQHNLKYLVFFPMNCNLEKIIIEEDRAHVYFVLCTASTNSHRCQYF